jgi:hypothetical protein
MCYSLFFESYNTNQDTYNTYTSNHHLYEHKYT